jgi:hypothetical protein
MRDGHTEVMMERKTERRQMVRCRIQHVYMLVWMSEGMRYPER